MVEEHRLFYGRPGEVKVLQDAVLLGDTVLQRAFVERQRGKVTQARMHAILNLKSNGSNTKADKPFEKALIKTCLSSFLAHNDGSKLTVITN